MSKIEWTEETWNPVTGCTRISEGCEHCYIERTPPMRMAHRRFDGPEIGATTGVQLHPERLDAPLHWRKPRRVFVNSMSDLFHDDVPDRFIAQVFGVMAVNEEHTYQVLTKRPARMRALLRSNDFRAHVNEEMRQRCGTQRRNLGGVCPVCHWNTSGNCAPEMSWPLRNVWLGVSTESQKWADVRIPQLLATPAAVRWISAEPLLGPIDLDGPLDATGQHRPKLTYWLTGRPGWAADGTLDVRPRLDWVVVGGETGPGGRPMDPAWARTMRDQCTAAGVPFFFKQWGDYVTVDQMPEDTFRDLDALHGPSSLAREVQWHVGKKHAGRELDGREWNEYPARELQNEEVPRGT